jgi:hypothetical protein
MFGFDKIECDVKKVVHDLGNWFLINYCSRDNIVAGVEYVDKESSMSNRKTDRDGQTRILQGYFLRVKEVKVSLSK